MRARVLQADLTKDRSPAPSDCRLPLCPWGWLSRWSGPTAGDKEHRPPGLSLKRNTEGQKAEAGVFFRKEIFAAATVWESLLSTAVRPGQEAPPSHCSLWSEANTFEDRKGRGEVSIKAAVEFRRWAH